jgi:hypothetical protein
MSPISVGDLVCFIGNQRLGIVVDITPSWIFVFFSNGKKEKHIGAALRLV